MASTNYRVIVAPDALYDLHRTGAYLARVASTATAERVLTRIERKIMSLSSMPERFRAETIAGRRFRVAIEGPYAIYYRVEGRAVRVLRMLHTAQDREAELGQ